MRLDEWRHVQATKPATLNQIGAIQREFAEHLGFDETDRAERLAICAALLDLDELDSTRDLNTGQAGQLYRLLLGFHDRDELRAAAGILGEDQAAEVGEDQAAEEPSGPLLADAVRQTIVSYLAWRNIYGHGRAGESDAEMPQ